MKTYSINISRTLILWLAITCTAYADAIPTSGTWINTLQPRDLNHDGVVDAYYDTTLNLTWLADWNLSKTSNISSTGRMDWSAAATWAANINIGNTSGWRLPTVTDTGAPGCDWSFSGGTDCGNNIQTVDGATGFVYSEMAHMFYTTLGNKAYAEAGTGIYPQADRGLKNTGPFVNMQEMYYWTNTEYALSPQRAWNFGLSDGGQNDDSKEDLLYAIAVHKGDLATPVPEPSTLTLALAVVLVLSNTILRKSKIGLTGCSTGRHPASRAAAC